MKQMEMELNLVAEEWVW